jgi:hypothetical protein
MTALFTSSEIRGTAGAKVESSEAQQPNRFGKAIGSDNKVNVRLGKYREALEEVIGQVSPNTDMHFVTRGDWSCHHLVEYLLHQTGPAEVVIACWTMSEDAARTLLQLIESDQILRLSIVFDLRAQQRKPAAYQLARHIASNCRIASCHAKVTVISPADSNKPGIAISGSANYTRNPRIEAGVLSTHKSAIEFHREWIQRILEESDPFL